MADRWSNPAGALGVNRFRVWPDKNADSWDTLEMVANFDKIDAMFGIPSAGGAWPPTEGADGGLYREIAFLKGDRAPIGSTVLWWRPNVSTPVPTGAWVACVGQTLTAAEHDFVGGGSITLPDTRNTVPLGADGSKALLDPGVAGDLPGNAPGVGGTGGSNAAKSLAHSHAVNSHSHGLNNHTHSFPHTHSLSSHTHNMNHRHKGGSTNNMTDSQNSNNPGDDAGVASGSHFNASKSGHQHTIGGPRETDDSAAKTSTGTPSVNSTGAATPDATAGPSTANSENASPGTDTQLSSVDTRMRFTGFVMVMKVKNTSSL